MDVKGLREAAIVGEEGLMEVRGEGTSPSKKREEKPKEGGDTGGRGNSGLVVREHGNGENMGAIRLNNGSTCVI